MSMIKGVLNKFVPRIWQWWVLEYDLVDQSTLQSVILRIPIFVTFEKRQLPKVWPLSWKLLANQLSHSDRTPKASRSKFTTSIFILQIFDL